MGPDWLRDQLVQRAKEHGPRPFMVGRSDRLDTVTDLWRRRLNKVFELAGEFETAPTPHRFRHYLPFRTMSGRITEGL